MRVEKRLWVPALGTLALLLAAGCSSKNPDSLAGMNVDENLAIMNGDENVSLNEAETQAPAANEASAAVSNQTSAEAASAPARHAAAANQEQNAQSNSIPTIAVPDEPTTGDQGNQNEDEPHSQF